MVKRPSSSTRKATAFPNVFSPYIAPFVPEPRLDTSRRLHNLIVDSSKLNLTYADICDFFGKQHGDRRGAV